MTARLPALGARQRWAQYQTTALRDDLLAAVTVSVLLLPQSLAYALLAGLPPLAGVLASLLPVLAYAAVGSSSTLAVGPVAVLALMTAQAVAPVAAAQGVDVHLAALVLALEMAAVYAAAALLRLEVFAALLGTPVLHGFITGAAIVIACGQLPQLFGLAVDGGTLTELALGLGRAGPLQPHGPTVAIGLATLGGLWAIRRFGVRAAGALGMAQRPAQLVARLAPILVVAAAIAWVAFAPDAATRGVALAGRVDLRAGFDLPAPWRAPWAVWWALLPSASVLALVAYVESLAVAEALAARRGEHVQPRRELLGLAAANLAAGASGGMPVTGSFSRSAVNLDAGARTRMAGVWTALLLGAGVWALGDVLRFLPKAVLAATIVVAVLSLLDVKPFLSTWRYARREGALMVLVTVLTVFVGIEEALGVGVLVAAGLLLQRTARPHWAEVGRLPGTEVFRNVKRFEVETLPHVLSLRIDESLLFTNSRWLSETLGAMPAQRPGLRHVVLLMTGVNDIDVTGLEALARLAAALDAQGVLLHFSELKGPVGDRLRAGGLADWLTGRVFRTQHDAQVELGGA